MEQVWRHDQEFSLGHVEFEVFVKHTSGLLSWLFKAGVRERGSRKGGVYLIAVCTRVSAARWGLAIQKLLTVYNLELLSAH